jgi:hypothetical protein
MQLIQVPMTDGASYIMRFPRPYCFALDGAGLPEVNPVSFTRERLAHLLRERGRYIGNGDIACSSQKDRIRAFSACARSNTGGLSPHTLKVSLEYLLGKEGMRHEVIRACICCHPGTGVCAHHFRRNATRCFEAGNSLSRFLITRPPAGANLKLACY